jgi:hypothetical protein
MGLSMAASRVCGICPHSAAPVLASRYILRAGEDAELADRAANPHRFSTGSQVLTSPKFLSSLRSRGAIAEVDVDAGGQVPDDGDFFNDAEPDVSPRHTNGGADGEVEMEL